jgi:hypothetical protein
MVNFRKRISVKLRTIAIIIHLQAPREAFLAVDLCCLKNTHPIISATYHDGSLYHLHGEVGAGTDHRREQGPLPGLRVVLLH